MRLSPATQRLESNPLWLLSSGESPLANQMPETSGEDWNTVSSVHTQFTMYIASVMYDLFGQLQTL